MVEWLGPAHVVQAMKARIALQKARKTQNSFEKVQLFKQADDHGACIPPEAYKAALRDCYELELIENRDFSKLSPKSLKFIAEAADWGCAESKMLLAEVIEAGFHPNLEREISLQIFEEAADLGITSAHRAIGKIHEQGKLAQRDDEAAFDAYAQEVAGLLIPRVKKGQKSREITDEDRERFLAAGDAIFEGKGTNASSVLEIWNLSTVYWKRAAGLSDPFSAVVETADLNGKNFDETAKMALSRLARAMYFGMGLRRNRAFALFLFWRTLKEVPLSQRFLLYHLKFIPEASEAVRSCIKGRLKKVGTGETQRALGLLFVPSERGSFVKERLSQSTLEPQDNIASFLIQLFSLDWSEVSELIRADVERFPKPVDDLLLDQQRLRTIQSLLSDASDVFERSSNEEDPLSFTDLLLSTKSEYLPLLTNALSSASSDREEVLIDFFALRVLLAELTDEEGVHGWKEEQRRFAVTSPLTWSDLKLTGVTRKVASKVRMSTIDFGPDPSGRDKLGFPLLGRKRDDRGFINRNRNPGWDRIHELKVSPSGFEVSRATKPNNREFPLVFRDDVEVILALAILEQNDLGEDAAVPSFSLEQSIDKDQTLATSLFQRKVFQPDWSAATNFGKSMYYFDSMLFLDSSCRHLVSNRDPLRNAAAAGVERDLPLVWMQAEHCGGVSASPSKRNAFVVTTRRPYDEKAKTILSEQPNGPAEFYRVPVPVELAHFDGGENYTDIQSGEERRDGGRYFLRYWAIRRVEVLTRGMKQVYESFPIYRRVAMLHGLYTTLRTFFTEERRKSLEGSELIEKLQKSRKNYIETVERSDDADRIVLLP